MSAIFDFSSLLTVFLLLVCTTTYIRELRPTIFDGTVLNHNGNNGSTDGQNTMGGDAYHDVNPNVTNNYPISTRQKHEGILGFFWKLSRIGERLSPYVSVGCIIMAINVIFF